MKMIAMEFNEEKKQAVATFRGNLAGRMRLPWGPVAGVADEDGEIWTEDEIRKAVVEAQADLQR